MERRENRTMAEIKQLACALLFVVPLLAIGTLGFSRIFGTRMAVHLAIGVGILLVGVFTLIVVTSIVSSYMYDLVDRFRERSGTAPDNDGKQSEQ